MADEKESQSPYTIIQCIFN